MRSILLFLLIITFSLNLLQAQVPTVQWNKAFGGTRDDYATAVKQTLDGGYITGSTSWSQDGDVTGAHGVYDLWIVKHEANGNIQWKKCLGGSLADYFYDLQLTSDGGYIILGRVESNDGDIAGNHGLGVYNIWVVKLNSNGVMQWQKCIGSSSFYNILKIAPTMDGGYILGGGVSDAGQAAADNTLDCSIIKLSSVGDIQWEKRYGGSKFDHLSDILQVNDGGYLVLARTASADGDVAGNNGADDIWLFKINSTGIIEWKKCLGGSSWDYPIAVEFTSDNGYLLLGATYSNDGDVSGHHGLLNHTDAWIVKVTGNGIILWQKCVGGTKDDWPAAIDRTDDNGFIMSGYSKSNDGDNTGNFSNGVDKAWILKISESGSIEGSKFMGGSASDIFLDIQKTDDGGYIVVGSIQSTDAGVAGLRGLGDLWLVKLAPLPCLPTISIAASINEPCEGSPVTFTATSSQTRPASIFQWKKNGLPVGQNSPVYTDNTFFNADAITCEYTSNAPCAGNMIVLSNIITIILRQNPFSPVMLGNDKAICRGESLLLNAHAGYLNYSWQDGSQDSVFLVTSAGKYYVTVTDSCGTVSSDTVLVRQHPIVSDFLPKDITACIDGSMTITSTIQFSEYLWNNNSQNSSIDISAGGLYWLQVKDVNNCTVRDSVLMTNNCKKDFYMPTAFTPNTDNLNDVLKPAMDFAVTHYQLNVFNRWGKLVFTSTDPNIGWDGRAMERLQDAGTYIWNCKFTSAGNKLNFYKGFVLLMR